MKILTLNTNDISGGAAIAAYRLHKALLNAHVNSTMMVYNKTLDDPSIIYGESKIDEIRLLKKRLFDIQMFPYRKTKTRIFSTASSINFSFNKRIKKINPDIIHLHWINSEFFNIESIKRMSSPIIWSLHDMWPFTGGCHYTNSCDKYQSHCMYCPALGSNKKKDPSYYTFERKISNFDPKKITFIGLSKWITNKARKSAILNNFNIINIPNCIDTNDFFPIEKFTSRTILGINTEKKIIIFGASGGTADPRKGFSYLNRALSFLESPENLELICFGGEIKSNETINGIKTQFWGPIRDSKTMQLIFSAADVTVVPSLEENLSNTIMESMACGTPVVAFDIGGNSDMIDHLENGYLASLISSEELAKGLNWVLFNKNYQNAAKAAVQKILSDFDSKLISLKYKKLYEKIIINQTN